MTNLSPIDAATAGRSLSADIKPDRAEIRPSARARRGDDRVEVSETARFLAKMNAMPEIRSDLVSRVREELAAGSYDTDERFDLAVDAMIDELN